MKLLKMIKSVALVFALPALLQACNVPAQDATTRTDKSANKPAVVVYPVAMTNVGAPITSTREPVVEARELEIDTPIGQVRNVLKTLDELRAGQKRELQALEALRQTTATLVEAQQKTLTALERIAPQPELADAPEVNERKEEHATQPQANLAPTAQSRYETLWFLARVAAAFALLWLILRGVKSAIQEAREKTK